MDLIIPAAGKSSRFPNVRPKWMLTHPSGNMMLMEAIRGLNLKDFKKIYLAILKEHQDQYDCIPGIKKQFEMLGVLDKVSIVVLERPTKNQPETVAETIRRENIEGPFFSKDTDNFFECTITPGNCVCVCDLNSMDLINASNKSYAQFDNHRRITNIIEKKVVSSHFCVGGYGFSSSAQYLNYYQRVLEQSGEYISDVIFQMIIDNHPFYTHEVKQYLDWGTLDDWNRYKREFSVLFVDIDGTLIKNSGMFLPPYWGETDKITENVDVINRLYESNKVQIILTTSRNESYRDITLAQLAHHDIKYHQIIFGLFHTKRIIINDYASGNPYKACDAINIRRDSNELKELLEDTVNLSFIRKG